MTTSKQTVAIKVNQANLMANLKFSFSNKHTILGEMMQNARRAGATFVRFETNDQDELVVLDNGKGIGNFQNLFSVAESGWDAETLQKEKPFGMGWLSCLYGSNFIYVESNGRYIHGNTHDIIGGAGLEVLDVLDYRPDGASYTRISLDGFSLTQEEVKKALFKLAYGFAIDVYLNDELLARKDDAAHLMTIPDHYHHFVDENLGDFFVPVGNQCIKDCDFYLQGLPVSNRYDGHHRFSHKRNIVHLDSEKVFARMPDRDKLIDEADVLVEVRKAIHGFHLKQLQGLKASLSPEDFATRDIAGYAKSIVGGFDVIAAKDVRLSDLFYGLISDQQPSCNSDADKFEYDASEVGDSIAYEQFQSGEVFVCDIDDMDADEECSNAAAFIFARKLGWKVLCDREAANHWNEVKFEFSKHWLNEFLFKLDATNIEVTINQESKREQYGFGEWNSACTVVLCESYKLAYTHKSGMVSEVEINNEPLLTSDGELLVPDGCSNHSAAFGSVEQGHSYYWEDEFHDDVRDEDANAFELYLALMRTGNECEAISGLVNSNVNFYEYSQFKGVEYKFIINEQGKAVITKLETATQAA